MRAQSRTKGREASPGQDLGNSREPGQLSLLRQCGFAPKLSGLTVKTNWSDTSPPRCVRCCRSRPRGRCGSHPIASPPSHSALSSKSQNSGLARSRLRLVAGDAVTPRRKPFAAFGGWHARPAKLTVLGDRQCGSHLRACGFALLTNTADNKHCAFAPSFLGRTFILIVETLPASQCPSPRNKGSHNVALSVGVAASLSR